MIISYLKITINIYKDFKYNINSLKATDIINNYF